jgi:hypothetical protein
LFPARNNQLDSVVQRHDQRFTNSSGARFLAWDRRDLAKKAVVTIYTVERIETGADISGTAGGGGY